MTTIHLAGDSTVAPGPLDGSGVIGWGGVFAEFVAEPVANRAVGGATTNSFQAEGRWTATLDALEPEDFVLIQFGHNDQKEAVLDADGGYAANLTAFVAQVRDRGALPVLLTSAERCLFDENGELRASHGPYPRAVRRVAHTLDVPLIDLNVFTRWLYRNAGPQGCETFFPHANPTSGNRDTTHFGLEGARVLASFVAEALRAIRGLDDNGPAVGTWGYQA